MTATSTGEPPVPPPALLRRVLAPSFPELWLFLAVALPVVAGLAVIFTSDLAWLVRAGQLMLGTGTIVTADPFTFTVAGAPWANQQWGSALLLALLYEAGGWPLLVIVRAVILGVVSTLVLRACLDAGASRRTSALLALAAFLVAAPTLAMRPQLFGALLFAATQLLLLERRRHPGRTWAIPFLVAAWVNLHGTFFFGPLLVGVAWLEDRTRRVPGADRLLPVAVAAAAATLLNPWGVAVWAYVGTVGLSPTIRNLVTEWQTTLPLDAPGIFFWPAAVGLVVLVARGEVRRRTAGLTREAAGLPSWPQLLWLLALAAFGAYAKRGVLWWALAAPPVVAALLSVRTPARETSGNRRVNGLIAAAVVAAGVLLAPTWRTALPGGDRLPVVLDAQVGLCAATRAVAGPTDRLFVPQAMASWFELDCPGIPVFVDSRIELYPDEVWRDYLAVVSAGPGWQEILERWKVTLVVVSPEDAVAAAIASSPRWRLLHSEKAGALYQATSSPGG